VDKVVGYTRYKLDTDTGALEAVGPRLKTCTAFKEREDIVIILPASGPLHMGREIQIPIEILKEFLAENGD
jgi:hypothetical protein